MHKEDFMNGRAQQKYYRYHQWWGNTEKIIRRMAVILFLLLYVVQLLNFIVEQRDGRLLTREISKLEGTAIADSQTQINLGTIELTVTGNSDYENIRVYINGEFYKSFEKKSIALTVKNNDIIEISGINSAGSAIVKITSMSENVISPKLNKTVHVTRGFVQTGRVRLK